jgi:hypothetical protein
MTPGTILHDPQFLCHDKTTQNKLLVVLNDGSMGNYILVKTTSKGGRKARTPGCHAKDRFHNFFILKGQSNFPEDTWVMLDEFHEFERKELLRRSLQKYIQVKGNLPENLVKSLLVCAKNSPDISAVHEAILDDTLTRMTLNMSIETPAQSPHPITPAPTATPSKPVCPNTDCSYPLDLQQREPIFYWCAMCRKWFDGQLNRL